MCDPGFYCPKGQRQKDPPDYTCNEGHYCPGGTETAVQCESGTWTDLKKQSKCKECVEGYYCDRKEGVISNYADYPCPNGYYCPNGTRYAEEYGCPNGTFGNGTKLTRPDQCLQCPAGRYCFGMSLI